MLQVLRGSRWAFAIMALALLVIMLAGCAKEVPVEVIRTQIVEVPVYSPCVDAGSKPAKVTPIKERIPRAEWDALSTDQREAFLLANGQRRVVYENEAEIVFVRCGFDNSQEEE